MQPGGNSKIGSGDRDEALSGILANVTMGGLTPRWIRPCPPRYPVHRSEVRLKLTHYLTGLENYPTDLKWFNFLQLLWIDPDNKHELVWDDKMCADTSRGATVRDLLVKGLKVTLSPTEQEVYITLESWYVHKVTQIVSCSYDNLLLLILV